MYNTLYIVYYMGVSMEEKIFETTIGGKKVEVNIGRYAMQADGSCIVSCGDTIVMVNATVAEKPRDGVDFLPLSVDYEEKLYAVGKIPGGYKKREGKPTDKAILVSRLIDRPLRPLFPKGFHNDISIVATPLSIDPDVYPEPLAMLGSSIALSISSAPFEGPTGAVNVGLVDGKFIINPTQQEREISRLNLTVAGTHDAVLMVEAGAKFVDEETMLKAIMFAHDEIKKQVEFQLEIMKQFSKEKKSLIAEDESVIKLESEIENYVKPLLEKVLDTFVREERQHRNKEMKEQVLEHFSSLYPGNENLSTLIEQKVYSMTKQKVRENIVKKGIRLDGRKLDEIRPIWCEAGILPRVHGSGVFTRGQTQVLTTCTLGMLSEMQHIEGLEDIEEEKRYMHHYNMPPYSTGEAKMLRSPGRREIGHGALAERALEPVLPTEEEFPYAIRTVSEVLSSNGSTSQASVCGSTLALMDAGVPISSPVAGIAMGLIKEGDETFILTDIQGEEDFYGDMDFKVAGTERGITAIQMDIKIKGINENILKNALERAKIGRLFIMNKMLEVISEPRKSLSKYAPKIISFNIDPDKIREVIGTGGKNINKIIDATGVKIDIEDNGFVTIASCDGDMIEKAKNMIQNIVLDIEAGMILVGTVVKISDFGAFVSLTPTKDGLIHISKLSDKRVEKVEDVVKVGDNVKVEVLKVDNRGRIDLKLIQKM